MNANHQMSIKIFQMLPTVEVTLIGSWTFSKNGQADCANFVSERQINVDALFTHEFKLEEAEEAYQLFDKQTTGKGVFLM